MSVVHNAREAPRLLVRTGASKFRKRKPGEDPVSTAAMIALLWIGFFGFVPVGVAMVVGLIQGTIEDEVTAPSPGYPAFPTLSVGLVVPAMLVAFAFVRSFTWPLKNLGSFSRSDIAWVALMGFGVGVVSSVLDQRFLPMWAARVNLVVLSLFLAVWVLAWARIMLGWLKFVPRSWREEPTKIKRKRTS